jgi:hypothetical protein
MFNAAEEMSPLERAFVKEYALALIRDADLVRCVVGLMEPDGLDIKDVVDATDAAIKLCVINEQFLANLTVVSAQAKLDTKKSSKFDQAQEKLLLDIFGLSFFKLAVKDESSFVKKKYDAGWFSGKPTEWSNLLNKAYGGFAEKVADKNHPPAVMEAFAKLFNLLLPNNFYGNKLWPPEITQDFLLYYDEYYEDDLEDEEEDYNY